MGHVPARAAVGIVRENPGASSGNNLPRPISFQTPAGGGFLPSHAPPRGVAVRFAPTSPDGSRSGCRHEREDDAGAGASGAPGPGDEEGTGGEGSSDGSIQSDQSEPASPTTTLAPATTFTTIRRVADIARLLEARKLILVLDLDHTVVNSTGFLDFSATEIANGFSQHTGDIPGMGLFRLDFPPLGQLLTKLRPFVHGFLQEASAMFEMHVYTLGEKGYAREIVKLLDPDGAYFGARVISSAESTRRHRKSLDVVVPAGERAAVVILDDTEGVWEEHMDNLILVERYLYFASTCRNFGYTSAISLAEAKREEREHDGALAVALGVLRRVHRVFFDSVLDGHFSDVRVVIAELRREVLRGCTLAFSRVIPLEVSNADHPAWRMAERLGAVCAANVGVAVTHVVAIDAGTEKARWALQHGKFLVNPNWIYAANVRWSRPDEQTFPVVTSPAP